VSRKLALDDIADARAYERERSAFRARVIELKRRRRVAVGPIVTFVFENRDTVRFQIQEMARVEHIVTDSGIQAELDIYNPLVPEPGHLCVTMFLELVSDDDVRRWLPRLGGIERSVHLRLADGTEIDAEPDPAHAARLTREHVTAAVHYLSFALDQEQVKSFTEGAGLRVRHDAYDFEATLDPETRTELLTDLRP
jgi:hypothetical protein